MTSQLSPTPIFKAFDNNGLPLAFGLLTTYQAGTLTKQATYVDSTQTTQNTNPINLNFRGECALWLDPTLTYKFALTDQSGNTIPGWPVDNIPGGFGAGQLSVNLIPNPTNTYTLGSATNTWAQLYLGANAATAYDSVSGNIGYYARVPAEISASVTPTNPVYAPGDIRRYGAKIDGTTDDTTSINNAIKVAIAGLGLIYHPGGTCIHASQILFATSGFGFTVQGSDRSPAIFKYTGSAANSAWRITNNPATPSAPIANSSGAGLVNFTNVQITTAITSSTAAGIEINACGFSFYNITQCLIAGTFKYGLILDGTEVITIDKCIIQNNGTGAIANSANIWVVNGSDRTVGQVAGFSNSIWIRNNQLNINGTGSNNVADDGGSDHYIDRNNLNGAAVPLRLAGIDGFSVAGNEMENGLGGAGTGEANVDFLVLSLSGTSVGPCQGGEVVDNFFGADMAAGSQSLNFGGGGTFHSSIRVHGNWFRNNNGSSSDINVTKLANSVCGPNYSLSSSFHYTGVHNDSNGNELYPPQNSYPGTLPTSRVYGDSRLVNQFVGGVSADSPNGLQIDEQQWNCFTIQIINNAGTLQIQIFDSGVTAAAAGYAAKIINQSASAINVPTISSGAGFGSAPGGLVSGSTSVLVLNTAAQVVSKNNCQAMIEQYNGNVTSCLVYCGIASRNINGVTQYRPEIRLVNSLTGATVNFDTTYLPAGKIINIKFSGYLS